MTSPTSTFRFFKELVQYLGFPASVAETDDDHDPGPEQLKADMRQAVQELSLAQKGLLKRPALTEFLDEVSH